MARRKAASEKMWGRYLAAVGAAAVPGSAARGDIVYFDPPNETVTGDETRFVDFATNDFTSTTSGVALSLGELPYGNDYASTEISGIVSGIAAFTGGEGTHRFSSGDSIGPAGGPGGWTTLQSFVDYYDEPGGFPWNTNANNTAGFVGVRLNLNGNTHYGWIGLTYNDAFHNIVLRDFAYEDVPDTAILAGATAIPEASQVLILALGAAGVAAWRLLKRPGGEHGTGSVKQGARALDD
jgi:hypothetical protein